MNEREVENVVFARCPMCPADLQRRGNRTPALIRGEVQDTFTAKALGKAAQLENSVIMCSTVWKLRDVLENAEEGGNQHKCKNAKRLSSAEVRVYVWRTPPEAVVTLEVVAGSHGVVNVAELHSGVRGGTTASNELPTVGP